MADLHSLKPSITQLPREQQLQLIRDSRSRRTTYYKKPDKKNHKKIINKLSQAERIALLAQLEGK